MLKGYKIKRAKRTIEAITARVILKILFLINPNNATAMLNENKIKSPLPNIDLQFSDPNRLSTIRVIKKRIAPINVYLARGLLSSFMLLRGHSRFYIILSDCKRLKIIINPRIIGTAPSTANSRGQGDFGLNAMHIIPAMMSISPKIYSVLLSVMFIYILEVYKIILWIV